MLGIMIDCSRNAVMKPSKVKEYADYMSKFGYDTLMLYTEETYEVDGEPYFGHMRGRYTKDELKDLDAYCKSIGIELIPCIQTLAHLNEMFKWGSYDKIRDLDDVLLIDEERTYTLIDNIFKTLRECFSTNKIHIGMDEAYNVGLGKYLEKHGYQDRFETINKHLHKVCEMAKGYSFEPMIWSDMFTKLALNTSNYYLESASDEISKRANLPDNVSLVYWDYYSTDTERYVRMIEKTKCFNTPVLFAGGIWSWRGFVTDIKFSIDTSKAAIEACKRTGVNDMIFTIWGDDGAECTKMGLMPALLYVAEMAKGNFDEEDIKKKFKAEFNMDFDDFYLLDKPDHIGGKHHKSQASKYLLYNDPFNALFDSRITGFENEFYASLRDEFDRAKVTDEFKLSFAYLRELCDALSVKSELSFKTRKLYAAGDKKGLLELAETDYIESVIKIKKFQKVFRELWFDENKPHGFDVQDMRIGALVGRIESCRERLVDFCDGKYDSIPELEEPVLEEIPYSAAWSRYCTANTLSHIF